MTLFNWVFKCLSTCLKWSKRKPVESSKEMTGAKIDNKEKRVKVSVKFHNNLTLTQIRLLTGFSWDGILSQAGAKSCLGALCAAITSWWWWGSVKLKTYKNNHYTKKVLITKHYNSKRSVIFYKNHYEKGDFLTDISKFLYSKIHIY